MNRRRIIGTLVAVVLFLFVPRSYAQSGNDVYWHIDPAVKTCSMVIDPSLTQEQWRTFTRQAGAIATFKGLAPATTLGRGNFTIGIDGGYTPVDQRDPAWINTFTHPDETCPLGDAVSYPALRARLGVWDQVDAGAYWTTAPNANYGFVGGELKYAFLQESASRPAGAVRANVTLLTGVPDFNMSIYGLDLVASKRVARLTPYVGIREGWIVGTETTDKVDLKQERSALTQGYAGVVYSAWLLDVAAEFNLSTVNTFALAIGYRR